MVASFLLVGMLSISGVRAVGPTTHFLAIDKWFSTSTSDITKLCKSYRTEFEAGAMVPDITVRFYYTNGGAQYKVTHNWNFVNNVMAQAKDDRERCFAYGIAIGHEIPDYVSHNLWIPKEITKYGIKNDVLHPALEGVLEAQVINKYPYVYGRTQRSLDILLPNNPKYIHKAFALLW